MCLQLEANTAVCFNSSENSVVNDSHPKHPIWAHLTSSRPTPALRNAFEVSGKSAFHRRNCISQLLLRLRQYLHWPYYNSHVLFVTGEQSLPILHTSLIPSFQKLAGYLAGRTLHHDNALRINCPCNLFSPQIHCHQSSVIIIF